MIVRLGKRWLTGCSLLCIPFYLTAAQNDSIRDETEWRLRDKAAQEALDQKMQVISPPIQLPQVDDLPDLPHESVCFVIDSIDIKGLLSDWATSQGDSYIGQCMGFDSIQAYVRLINQKLLAEGYITSRAVLPEQNIASHVLVINIQEGIIEKIEFPEDYRFFWRHSLPLQVGDVLNLRDMEQAVDQLNRLQSQDVEFKIQPGTYSNASILVAQIKQTKPWSVGFSVDDSGSRSTGKYPLSLSGVVDNVVGVQDVLQYSFSRAREKDSGESNSASITWSLPIGYWLLEMSNSRSDYRQETVGSVRTFELSGTGDDKKIALNYVLSRDNKSKTSLLGAVKTRNRRSYIDDTEIEVQQRNLTELELGASYRKYLPNAVLDFSLSMHQGVEWLGADKVDSGASSNVAQPNYRFYSLTTSVSAPFSLLETKMNYSGRLFMQYADTAIYSLDWFSNGGRYTVRGFSGSESLSAESGWRLRNDIALPFSIKRFSTTGYLGLDIGEVYGDGAEEESSKTLMGISLGFKGQLFGANYDVSVSEPFLAHGPYAKAHDYKVSAMLSAQF
ncbi:hemolysin activation/secretion protein [Marinomonas alcarazii]|uniref:Hemolysin activation/secretion protein n=1 Tax=Marinomonas alcarazii TaxID=491949 RepID=A0A318V266_9GAMM|nr:ShlB/FhaC/HecB family hemolysin secretion/activation protein [Marinomonas alcarazii]PYF81821.1 hemolysin activation/secretion protein [Marinomonas alcarazii]